MFFLRLRAVDSTFTDVSLKINAVFSPSHVIWQANHHPNSRYVKKAASGGHKKLLTPHV